jgi:hypothetical protein
MRRDVHYCSNDTKRTEKNHMEFNLARLSAKQAFLLGVGMSLNLGGAATLKLPKPDAELSEFSRVGEFLQVGLDACAELLPPETEQQLVLGV